MSSKILEFANRGRYDERVEVDDLVWLLNEYQIPGTARKLNKKWVGPYKVEKVIREGAAYQLSNPFEPESNILSRAAEKIKRFHPESEFLDIQEHEVSDEEEELIEEVVQISEPLESDDSIREEVEQIPRYPKRIRKPKVIFTP